MTVVAGGGSVAITVYVRVNLIGLGLLVRSLGVAVDAGEAGVVGGDLVAIVADRFVVRDREISMVESCAKPSGGGVACVASSRITGGDVIRDCAAKSLRAVPIGGMAAVTRGVRRGEGVVVVDVAQVAGGRKVSAGERPTGGAVIERAGLPGRGVVASGAQRSGKSRGDVIGHSATHCGCAGPRGSVAAVAIGIGGGQIVIVVDVAQRAGSGDVSASQREASGAVIKIGSAPTESGVTVRTVDKGEGRASRGVGRIIGLLPGGQMASGCAASRGSDLQIVIVGDVAIGAGVDFAACGRELVQVLQWEAGGVVTPGRSPIAGGVTGGALGSGKTSRGMVRHRATHCCSAVPLSLVATVAIGVCGGEIVIVVDVAIGAGRGGVYAGQRPTGRAVIESCSCPSNGVVASGAIGDGKRSTGS